MDKIRGKAFILNDNVDTDQILPGYAMSYPVDELKNVTLCGSIIPDFSKMVREGDIIIAGDNFGCGSSREQAPVAIKTSGVGIVVAKSFARIFRRNSINIGLPVITCKHIDKLMAEAQTEDVFQVNLNNYTITNVRTSKEYKLDELSNSALETLQAGGLIEKVRKKLSERGVI